MPGLTRLLVLPASCPVPCVVWRLQSCGHHRRRAGQQPLGHHTRTPLPLLPQRAAPEVLAEPHHQQGVAAGQTDGTASQRDEGSGGGGLTIIIHAATSELVLLLTTSFRLSPAALRQQKILSLGPHIICFGHGPPLVLLNGPLEMGEEDAAVEGVAVGQ